MEFEMRQDFRRGTPANLTIFLHTTLLNMLLNICWFRARTKSFQSNRTYKLHLVRDPNKVLTY